MYQWASQYNTCSNKTHKFFWKFSGNNSTNIRWWMSTKLDAPDMVSFFYQSGKERKFPPIHTSKPYQPDISQLNIELCVLHPCLWLVDVTTQQHLMWPPTSLATTFSAYTRSSQKGKKRKKIPPNGNDAVLHNRTGITHVGVVRVISVIPVRLRLDTLYLYVLKIIYTYTYVQYVCVCVEFCFDCVQSLVIIIDRVARKFQVVFWVSHPPSLLPSEPKRKNQKIKSLVE
jgi:proteasome lid subunit RPN8/RPN11